MRKDITVGILRKSVLAVSLIGAGLVSTTGAAFAQDHGQDGFANVDSVQTITPANACNNDVPANALGAQVPVEDVSAAIPALGESTDGAAAQPESQACGNTVAGETD